MIYCCEEKCDISIKSSYLILSNVDLIPIEVGIALGPAQQGSSVLEQVDSRAAAKFCSEQNSIHVCSVLQCQDVSRRKVLSLLHSLHCA
jgi:hypothetical protein